MFWGGEGGVINTMLTLHHSWGMAKIVSHAGLLKRAGLNIVPPGQTSLTHSGSVCFFRVGLSLPKQLLCFSKRIGIRTLQSLSPTIHGLAAARYPTPRLGCWWSHKLTKIPCEHKPRWSWQPQHCRSWWHCASHSYPCCKRAAWCLPWSLAFRVGYAPANFRQTQTHFPIFPSFRVCSICRQRLRSRFSRSRMVQILI